MKSADATYYDTLHRGEWKTIASYGPSFRTRYRIMARLFRNSRASPGRVLEVGASSGSLGLFLKEAIPLAKLDFTDFSPESVSHIKELGVGEVFVADLTKLSDFGVRRYETILASEVLEHIVDDTVVLRNLHALLEPLGTLLISVPSRKKYWSRHDTFSGHVRRYEPGELEKNLVAAGFEIATSLVWGAFFYNLYAAVMTRLPPSALMKRERPGLATRFVVAVLYLLFFCDDVFVFTRRGRRLFVVAKKKASL